MNLVSKAGQKQVVERKTEKLEERERKALYLPEGKGQDDNDDDDDDDDDDEMMN